MENYASFKDTVAVLEGLGFKQVDEPAKFWDSPNIGEYNMPVIQARIYQTPAGYWAVDLEGMWKAPVVWKGPKAKWDKSDTTKDFVLFLDQQCKGWR